MHRDPRQWKVVIDGRPLVSFEELVNHLHEAGFRVIPGPVALRRQAAAAAGRECDHKFVDSKHCLKCGIHIDELRERSRLEAEQLLQHGPSPDYRSSEKS